MILVSILCIKSLLKAFLHVLFDQDVLLLCVLVGGCHTVRGKLGDVIEPIGQE